MCKMAEMMTAAKAKTAKSPGTSPRPHDGQVERPYTGAEPAAWAYRGEPAPRTAVPQG